MEPILGAPAQAHNATSSAVKDISTAEFTTAVLDASFEAPVIVDFWAPWCGPCKQLGPMLEKAVAATKGAVRMVKMNIDAHPQVAQQLRVQSIPAVFAFKDGRPVDGFVGSLPESQIKTFIDRLVKLGGPKASPIDDMIATAKAALAQGYVAEAAPLYAEILQQEPDRLEAVIGLAQCYLKTGQIDQAQALAERLPEAANKDPDAQALRAALDLAATAKPAGDIQTLKEKIASNPKDNAARFDLAMAFYGAKNPEGAVDTLLDLFRLDRTWNDDAARKQLVKIFDALGANHEITLSGRRRLSSLMFS
ncbi:MAG: thioredoxin [Alphaproteobacteria bacterium]